MIKRVYKAINLVQKLPKQQTYLCSTSNQQQQQPEFIPYKDRLIKKSDNPSGQVYEQSGQILHFAKLEQGNESLNKVASTSISDTDVVILSIKDKVNLGLQTKAQNNIIHNVGQIKGGLNISLNLEKTNRQIINYQGKNLSTKEYPDQQDEQNQNFKIFKHNKIHTLRQKNKAQCFTGNLAVDFTQPIARGHVSLLKGAPRAGKSRFMAQTLLNHVEQSNQYLHGHSKNGVYGIYCTSDIHQAKEIQKFLGENEADNYTVYSQDTGSLCDNFFLPFTALQHANYLVKEKKMDVVFMFDDAYNHFFNELNVFAEVDQPFSPISILKELFTCTGSFKDSGSLTTFIALDENNYKIELSKEAIKFEQECESLSDNIINFDLKAALTLPRLKYQIKENVFQEIYQNPLHFALQRVLLQILKQLENQKYSVDMKKQLGLEIEPWDYYLFNDSRFFQKLLTNSGYYKPIEQIVLMSFIIRSIQEEVSSQFKDNQRQLIDSFFEFSESFRDFEDERNIFEYIEILLSRDQPEMVLQHCERMYELFIMHLQMNDKLHPFKKDYLI